MNPETDLNLVKRVEEQLESYYRTGNKFGMESAIKRAQGLGVVEQIELIEVNPTGNVFKDKQK